MINNSLAAAGILTVSDQLAGGMLNQGVFYRGLQILGGGSTLGGLISGSDRGVHHRPTAVQGPPDLR